MTYKMCFLLIFFRWVITNAYESKDKKSSDEKIYRLSYVSQILEIRERKNVNI